jgi:hypothetical protein
LNLDGATTNVDTEKDTMRLQTLILAFEAELRDLGRLAETAQTTLSNVLAYAADDPNCHREAQVLDLLTQRLYGMSGFLERLAPGIPGIWQVNTSAAVDAVSLGHLADRLNGVAVDALAHDVGELEMF